MINYTSNKFWEECMAHMLLKCFTLCGEAIKSISCPFHRIFSCSFYAFFPKLIVIKY